jgi:hypothetical protein
MKGTPTYAVWRGLRQRCQNPYHKQFAAYGGRGIKVCERWSSFVNFLADMGTKPPGMSLDRIDNDKGYSKDNCRWATSKEQNNNRRDNRHVTVGGETRTIAEWADVRKMPSYLIYQRLRRGWTAERAVTPPAL